MKARPRVLHNLVFILFTVTCVFLTLNRHSRTGRFNYHAEIWADKAGYYIYTPSLLNYYFDSSNLPDSIEIKTGNGFHVEKNTDKIITKYTYGIALLQFPFYIVAEVYSLIENGTSDPFSLAHHKAIDLAAVFYLVVGFWFLFKFLRFYVDEIHAYLALLVMFIGTNLYYYSICDTGMSHVYSFSLFAYFLSLIKSQNYQFKTTSKLLKLGFVMGLIVLIRPVNIFFLSTIVFLDCNSLIDIRNRLVLLSNNRALLIVGISVLCVFIPQFIYWNYSSGNLINYSYNNEGFNWLSPHLLEIWFSPNNGLFVYNPIYLLLILASVYLVFKKKFRYLFIVGMFLLVSYVYSCWWDWAFGCGYGNRNFVEYTTILALPLAIYIKLLPKKATTVIMSIVLLLSLLNLMMIYHFDGCYFGNGNDDWTFYFRLIKF